MALQKKTVLQLSFKLSLLQERLISPNSPKEVEKYKVDDCVDHTNHHIEHADKEIVIGIVNVAAMRLAKIEFE